MILHLRAAVEQLYAAPPGEFTALRTQLAKQARSAGDVDLAKAVTALRKPTVAAWALNHFVREHGGELDDFRAFAELLREAQRTLDADQLRALGRERAKRVDAVAERVAQEARAAGQPLGVGCGPGGARHPDGAGRRRVRRGIGPHRGARAGARPTRDSAPSTSTTSSPSTHEGLERPRADGPADARGARGRWRERG